MTYLFLKEVAESTQSGEIIIVTASLTKDMNSPVDMFRANAIRVLCKIVEANMLTQIERYVKQAVVDRDDQVAAAALMSAGQMALNDPAKRRIISNWLPEIQNALSGVSRLQSVQYNALLVLYHVKSHDRLAVSKLVAQLSQQTSITSPLTVCLLVRYTARILHDDMCSPQDAQTCFKFLEACTRHRSEMVIYEAARAICRLPGISDQDIAGAVSVLTNFLKSSVTPTRFAAARTLSDVAVRHPGAVSKANHALENLISDRNRAVATMAITTLLKTGSEASVEPLTKQISGFMSELADEFKIVVVVAIRQLTLRYRKKFRLLLGFLSSVLREEGGQEFKRTILDAIFEIIDNIPEAQDIGMFHLCEFIEDCEFTSLSTLVLNSLAERGPKAPNPAKLVRYVYNRVILENAPVRAAAVSTLCAFGCRVPGLTNNIMLLLKRCQRDDDDEVRDRATACLVLLQQHAAVGQSAAAVERLLLAPLGQSAVRLQVALEMFRDAQQQQAAGGGKAQKLTFDTLPHVAEKEVTDHQRATAAKTGGAEALLTSAAPAQEEAFEDEGHLHERAPASQEELFAIPAFASYGALFKSSESIELTERETEYLVRCVKHVFESHVVLQFNLTNTLNDQVLTDVTVNLASDDDAYWVPKHTVPVARLPYDVTKSVYVGLERNPKASEDASMEQAFSAELAFKVKDVDPDADADVDDPSVVGYPETYAINDLDLAVADFVRPVDMGDFKSSWEQVGDAHQSVEQFELPNVTAIAPAVANVVAVLGLKPCEKSDAVPLGSNKHSLLLSGAYVGGKRIMCLAQFSMAEKNKVLLKVAVRSDDDNVTAVVMGALS